MLYEPSVKIPITKSHEFRRLARIIALFRRENSVLTIKTAP